MNRLGVLRLRDLRQALQLQSADPDLLLFFFFFFFEENGVTECESASYKARTMTHCKQNTASKSKQAVNNLNRVKKCPRKQTIQK